MSHETRVKQVREAFDASVLATICMADESYFEKYGQTYNKDGGKGKFAFYCKDDVSDVLGVAHMDSVQKGKDFGVAKYVSGKELVMSPTLDDRLGVYVICELLPKLGIKTDLLLTTDEESGNSTAKHFETTKRYKWMFQFDRTGGDVVMYQYDNPELRKKLEAAGFKCAQGSASDISKLSDLGCSGMNFGVGYEDYHWERAWADLNVTFDQVAKFMKFYKTHKSEHLVYDKTVTKVTSTIHSGGYPGMGSYSHSGYGYMADSESEHGRRINGTWYGKLIWDESKRAYLPNVYLYKNYPATILPSWDRICDQNERWDSKSADWVGRMTEDELYALVKTIFDDLGQETRFAALPKTREQRPFSQTSDSKALPGTSSNGYLSVEPTFDGLADDPCRCGHSRFVHNRTIWRKGGHVVTQDACDWWKCSCAGFEERMSEQSSDILAGG